MLQTFRAEKVDEKKTKNKTKNKKQKKNKKGNLSRVVKLSKKVHFLQFCPDLSKKPKSVKAIYIYASESSDYTLSENEMVYRCLSHRS